MFDVDGPGHGRHSTAADDADLLPLHGLRILRREPRLRLVRVE
jgi:hypothetical protein